jgi:hypothetical protein
MILIAVIRFFSFYWVSSYLFRGIHENIYPEKVALLIVLLDNPRQEIQNRLINQGFYTVLGCIGY